MIIKKKNDRQSNYELMRIISMLLIVTGHVLSWGGMVEQSNLRVTFMINLIYAITLVHVNSYLLLSGYFQCKSKFKIRKVIILFLLMWFYKALITFVGYKFGWFEINTFQLIWNLSPFDATNYWFIRYYIFLYCLSPFINKILNKLNKEQIKRLLIILFIFGSVLVTITNQEYIANLKGFSILHFVFIYTIGFYIRKYNIIDKLKKNKKSIVYCAAIFIGCFLCNYIIWKCGYKLSKTHSIPAFFFGKRILSVFAAYDNPLVVIGSVAYFLFFGMIKLKSDIINIISSVVLEVYMIHETIIFRGTLYSWFHLVGPYYRYIQIIKAVGIAVSCIFVGSCIIALTRKYLLAGIRYLLGKTNAIKRLEKNIEKLENKIDNYMNI